MISMRPALVFGATCLCLLLVAASSASADEIAVDVQTIYAHNAAEAKVDASLEPLAGELKSGFAGYNVFELIEHHELAIAEGETATLELPDKDASVFELTYVGHSADDEDLFELSFGLKGKITGKLKASPGSTFFQAGLFYRDGILILAIRADRVD